MLADLKVGTTTGMLLTKLLHLTKAYKIVSNRMQYAVPGKRLHGSAKHGQPTSVLALALLHTESHQFCRPKKARSVKANSSMSMGKMYRALQALA